MVDTTYYKYIYFELHETKPKTKVFACMNKSHETPLGLVKWYSPWRQYCFEPMPDTVFNKKCLTDIIDFLFTQNNKHIMNRGKS